MSTSSLTVKQLRYFIHALDAGSISRAADDLHVAQTALGIQIRALENELNTPLLQRNHNGVTATKAGRFVYERARQILQSVDMLSSEVGTLVAGTRREVFLGLTPTLMRGIGPRAVREQDARLQDMHLHPVEGFREQLIAGMQAGELEYVFADDVGSDGALRAIPVLRQPLSLVSRPGSQLAPGPVRFDEALETDIVVRGDTSHILDITTRAAAELGLAPNIAYEIDSIPAMKKIMLQFGATSILPADSVHEEIARGELEAHEIVNPSLELTLEFVMHEAQPPRDRDFPLLAFLDELLDVFLSEIGAESRRLGRLTSLVAPALVRAV